MIFRALSLQEVNVFLPLIKERFTRIHAIVAEGQLLHDALNKPAKKQTQISTAGMSTTETVANSSKSRDGYKKRRLKEIERQIRHEIIKLQYYGAIVKSVFPARVDFLSELHKQPIYLCWQAGDKSVSHWHSVDEGFAARRSIQSIKSFGPVVVH